MSDVRRLIEKLRRIDALHAGATTEGERAAADGARQRIKEKIQQYEEADPPIEYKFTLNNGWSRKLLLALLRRYGIRPYRYYRQRHNTIMARVSKGFVDKTLWPEFVEIDKELQAHLDAVAEKIINESIFADSSDAEEIGVFEAKRGRRFFVPGLLERGQDGGLDPINGRQHHQRDDQPAKGAQATTLMASLRAIRWPSCCRSIV